jgi:hypothetical protein
MLTKYGIHTLVDIVFGVPTWVDLLPQSCITQGFVASNVVQTKERSYCNWHLTDRFLPLLNEVFGCLHKHANVFLHDCVNTIWSLKGTEGFHLSTLVTFFCQKVSITLQRMQMFFILSWVATDRLPSFQDPPPITKIDLLQVVDFWHVNIATSTSD